MSEARVVVLGAGPTGLSAAYHLGSAALLVERELRVGGCCRSIRSHGFTFDRVGPVAGSSDPYVRELSQPAELAAAGVKFAIASFDNSFARRLGQNAANAVAHGLSHDEALRAVTINPAQILGLGSQIGTLEQGKIANLIVTNGDPLELTTDVKYLFIKGQLTSTENRHHRLYEKYLNRPKASN